jgi:recombination protein RecA
LYIILARPRLHNTSDEQALWIDTENALDEKYALKMGIDPDRLVIFYPETGERALEIAEGGIRSGEFAVVVLDSVAALSPRAEMEGDMGDAHVGLQARLMSQFVRKTAFAIRESEVAMVATNQLRDRIARIPLPPETPAGRALRHHSSLRIVLKNAGPIEQNNEIVGSKIEFLVKKNKVGAPYGTGAFEIWHDRGICLEADLLDTAVGLGVIKQKGAWFSHGENVLAQGRVAAIKALSDKEKYQEILQEIKELMVHRIFPLKPYENIQFINEAVMEDDEVGTRETYDGMVREIYEAYLDHKELLLRANEAETLDEKREVLNDGRD